MHRKPYPNTSSNAHFLHEIQTLSKALSIDPKSRRLSLPTDPKPRSEPEPEPEPEPDQKPKPKPKISSLFKWKKKPLKTQTRFDCRFTLRVHSVEGLPPALSNSILIVHWRRSLDPSGVKTRPVKALRGSVKFEESLSYGCSVYGSRSTKSSGLVKYESREFLIYVTVAGATGFDLGKHRVELTKILPLNLEELEGEKSSGEWSTSFRLGGRARGATLNVTFGYRVNVDGGDEKKGHGLQRVGSVHGVSFSGDKRVGRVLSEVQFGKQELEIDSNVEKHCASADALKENDDDDLEYTVIERGVEIDPSDGIGDVKLENIEVKAAGCEKDLALANYNAELERVDNGDGPVDEELRVQTKCLGDPTLKYLDFKNDNVPILEVEGLESSRIEFELDRINNEDEIVDQEPSEGTMRFGDPMLKNLANHNFPIIDLGGLESPRNDFKKIRSNYKPRGMKSKSLSLDDVSENIASEFLSMLGLEISSGSDTESPREQLWKQFEKENLTVNDSIFGSDSMCNDFSDDFDLSSMVHDSEIEHHKSRAQFLEDAETEALMHEWGLNENVFENSQPLRGSGFGSPIEFPLDEPQELPPLGEQFGPFLQTKDGGLLRSMSPSLFKASKNNGSLVMQASSPIVVPAELGADIMEILQGLASIGIEKLSMQASKLMPLEDITGKTMQQVAWEATPSLEACERLDMLQEVGGPVVSDKPRKRKGLKLESSRSGDEGSEYVSLEDLAPLAMDKIEALSIEGLRIQSGMSDEDAPSNIGPQFIGPMKNSGSLGLEGAGGLQLLDVKDNGCDVDGLMGLSITLDEWMRLDSGVVNEDDEINERTTKILAAHHAKSTDFLRSYKSGGKSSGRRCGLLGNNFTVALMVQLRDPFRNYEPVGSPMLALIQVERVFVPPKPKIYRAVFERVSSEPDDELETTNEPVTKEDSKVEEVAIPQFKITEVHVAGLKTEPGSKKLWGNAVKQQSGSRWLLANGMGKSNKHPFMKSNSIKKPSQMTSTVQPGDTLWSISSRIHGEGGKWKELAAPNPHIRNPNVNFPNETIRLC